MSEVRGGYQPTEIVKGSPPPGPAIAHGAPTVASLDPGVKRGDAMRRLTDRHMNVLDALVEADPAQLLTPDEVAGLRRLLALTAEDVAFLQALRGGHAPVERVDNDRKGRV